MFFVQKRFRFGWFAGSPACRGNSMNRPCIGKRKFVTQFHVDSKQKAPILHTENHGIGKK
jgi:hypothetical protein